MYMGLSEQGQFLAGLPPLGAAETITARPIWVKLSGCGSVEIWVESHRQRPSGCVVGFAVPESRGVGTGSHEDCRGST